MGFLVPDVWDLIYFNFRTENPWEVNYYMWRYLGCRRAAPDGVNFSFAEASPGVVYIPPLGWKRSDILLPLPARIADEIDSCGVDFPEIWHGNTHFGRVDLHAIATAIRHGRIDARHDFTIGNLAEYDSAANTITVHTPVFGDIKARRTLVHEATHAILDMKKAKHLTIWEDELLAFATQAQFTYNTDIYWAVHHARWLPAGPHKAALILAYYTNSNGKGAKILLEHDREEESFLDPGKTINPFRGLEYAIKHAPAFIKMGWWKHYHYDGI